MFDKRVVCIDSFKIRITKKIEINDNKAFNFYEKIKNFFSLEDNISFTNLEGTTNLSISNIIPLAKKTFYEKIKERISQYILIFLTIFYDKMSYIIPSLKSNEPIKVIEIYLDTDKIKMLMELALNSKIKNGDLLVLTKYGDIFDFTTPYLDNRVEIPCIYEYKDGEFKIYKIQPSHDNLIAENYIEYLKQEYPLLKKNDPVMPNMITTPEENNLINLIGEIYEISLKIDEYQINHDILDFAKNQIDYFFKYIKYVEENKIEIEIKEKIDSLILERKKLKENYINTRAKLYYLRCKRFFDKKIDLTEALRKGLTKEEFNELDIDNMGYITVSKFNTKKTYI